MAHWNQQAIFTRNTAKLIEYIFSSGYYCTLGECFRPPLLAAIYAKKGIGIEKSLHCNRMAIDLNLFSPEGEYLTDAKHYKKYADWWITLDIHNRAGYYFKPLVDAVHFEMNVK